MYNCTEISTSILVGNAKGIETTQNIRVSVEHKDVKSYTSILKDLKCLPSIETVQYGQSENGNETWMGRGEQWNSDTIEVLVIEVVAVNFGR